MKKNTMTTIAAYIKNVPELANEYAELQAELDKNAAKAQANRDLYATAHDVVMAHLDSTPVTVTELYASCEDELPDGFSKSKIQYALLNYWSDEVVKHDNGKKAFTYTRA